MLRGPKSETEDILWIKKPPEVQESTNESEKDVRSGGNSESSAIAEASGEIF